MEHERFLIGKDPTDIELLWQGMFRDPRWRGGPILNSAISAVEIALWDILGQALDVPIYKLLGGAARKRIRMYLDVGSQSGGLSESQRGRLHGREIRLHTRGKRFGSSRPTPSAKASAKWRPSAKPSATTSISASTPTASSPRPWRSTSAPASRNPVRCSSRSPRNWKIWANWNLLRQKTKVPLATGERSFTKYGFAEFCSRHLVNYIQPDVCHAGGIFELKKIGVLAETYRIEMAPHNPQSEVSTMASLHVDASTPASTIQESAKSSEKWTTDLFDGGAVVVRAGYADLPTRPGLGVTLNEKVAAQHPYKPVNRQNFVFSDGGVADH